MEDDVTNCKTEQMVKCREVTEGYITKEQCEEWPVQRCSIERKLVKKFTPETKCWSEPKQICGTEGCGFKNVSLITIEPHFTVLCAGHQLPG